jgi:hypothetical protein
VYYKKGGVMENLSDLKTVSTEEAAEILGCRPQTLITKRFRGGGPVFVKNGGSVRYLAKDLRDFINKNRRVTNAEAA